MESPQIHVGPIKNHETRSDGQGTGQNCNDSTDHNQPKAGEADLGQDCKKKKRRGPKRKVTNKPSQETEVTPDGPLISSYIVKKPIQMLKGKHLKIMSQPLTPMPPMLARHGPPRTT